jgi:glutathione peroxidase
MIRIAFIITSLFFTISIYSISATDINGGQINFSSFQGKKILIVNTASNSSYVAQYAALEQLYQQYKDSLVVIAFPSNSFGNEPGSNTSIKNFVTSTYNTHFQLAAKVEVSGSSQATIYQWLTQQGQNGMMNNAVRGDFQKFLVDKDGTLMGVFSSTIDPMDNSIQNAITNN